MESRYESVGIEMPGRNSVARRAVLEVDALPCPQCSACHVEMQIASVIQEVTVVDRPLAPSIPLGSTDSCTTPRS